MTKKLKQYAGKKYCIHKSLREKIFASVNPFGEGSELFGGKVKGESSKLKGQFTPL